MIPAYSEEDYGAQDRRATRAILRLAVVLDEIEQFSAKDLGFVEESNAYVLCAFANEILAVSGDWTDRIRHAKRRRGDDDY